MSGSDGEEEGFNPHKFPTITRENLAGEVTPTVELSAEQREIELLKNKLEVAEKKLEEAETTKRRERESFQFQMMRLREDKERKKVKGSFDLFVKNIPTKCSKGLLTRVLQKQFGEVLGVSFVNRSTYVTMKKSTAGLKILQKSPLEIMGQKVHFEKRRPKPLGKLKILGSGKENKELKKENKELKKENKDLKKQLQVYEKQNIVNKYLQMNLHDLNDVKGLEDMKVKCTELKSVVTQKLEEIKNRILEKEKSECKICCENEVSHVLTPCGHVFCLLCIERIKKEKNLCPICRKTIKDVNKFFLP